MDYYVVLGIAENADEDTIRSAFRALARRYHPDAGAGSSSVEFQRAREAYETLVDPARRHHYDQRLRASRARRVVVGEVMMPTPFAEPLLGSRQAPFRFHGAGAPATRSPLLEEIVEEFFASLEIHWFRSRLWR